MKTVSVTANASDPQALHRKALAAALAQQQGGLGFPGQQAAPAVAGNAGLALALGNFGASAAQGIMASREADKQAAATEAARSRFSRMVGSYAPGGPGAGGGPGRSPSGPVAGNFQGAGSSENAAAAVRYFQDKGLPEHSARALVGGFQAESGSTLNTGARNRGDGTDGSDSIGIGQWNSGRAAAMRQFAASNGRNPGDLHTQLDFAWQELNGPEKATLNRLMAAKDDHDATAAAVGYERPAGWSADNPTAAVTFGKRLANTTALAGLGQSAPTATASADMPASNAQPATAPGLPGDMMSAPQSAAATAAADAMPGNDSDVRMSPGSVPAFLGPQQRALASALMTPDGASAGLTPANPNGAPDVMTQPSDLMNNAPRPDQGGMNTNLGGFTGSPYGEIPATTGDPSAQSLAWALGQQMGGQSTAPSLGTDATLSQSNARSQAQGGAAFPADVGAAIGADSGVPAIMGASFVSDKARGQGGAPFADMSGSIRNGSPAPQMAGADVPLPPVRPNQAIIDALGAPSSAQMATDPTPTDPTPTGSIDMGGAANMPAPNAQPAMAPGIPPSALAAALGDGGPGGGFSPIGKNANFQTPTQFNLQQAGGSQGGNPLVAALASYTPGQQAPAPTPAGPSPQALAGALGQGSAFRTVMDGGDIQQVARQQDARLNGSGNAVLANAVGGGPAIIPAPAGAPPAQAGGWQQDAALILSDPYATPQMQAYAKDLLEKSMPQQRALQNVTGPDGQLYVFDPASGGYTKGPEGTKAATNHFVSTGDGGVLNTQTGEVQRSAQDGPKPMFDGKSVEGQGLNHLVQTGQLTEDQAAQFAAGKTVTDPSTGAVTFMTPQGVFKTVQPQAVPGGAPPPAGSSGMIPLTPPKPEKFTNDQTNAAGFANRMADAEKIFGQASIQDAETSSYQRNANAVPFVGNYLASSNYQQADQAERNFINAQLRKESGAAIGPDEFANARKQYLPQPGDGPAVLAQKSQNRAAAIQAMQGAAGGAFKVSPSGAPAAPAAPRVAPQMGEVQRGYRFTGGDPSQASNWQKVQ